MIEVIPYDDHYLILCLIITVVMQLSFFSIAFCCKFDKVTDFAGSLNFLVLIGLTLVLGNEYHLRQVLATVLFALSRTWLMCFLLYRVLIRGKDDRFDKVRDNFVAFLVFWIFQMFWAFLVSSPVVWLNSTGRNPHLGWADYLGLLLLVVGTFFEVCGDIQKYIFRNNPDNRGLVCDSGLWSLSRHPPYFGEICISWGTFFMALPVFMTSEPAGYCVLLGPFFTMFILIFGSGIPTGEGKFLARFYKTEESANLYEAYRKKTPPLIPCLPFIYGNLPMWFKRIFCLEFPFYEYRPPINTKGDDGALDKGSLGADLLRENPERSEEDGPHRA